MGRLKPTTMVLGVIAVVLGVSVAGTGLAASATVGGPHPRPDVGHPGQKVKHPRPRLKWKDAMAAATEQGNLIGRQGVAVESLTRKNRYVFTATLSWSDLTGIGSQTCRQGVRITSKRSGIAATLGKPGPCDPGDYYVDPKNPGQSGPGPKRCPGNLRGAWDAVPDLVGKPLDEAVQIASQHGCQVRTVFIDGVGQIITMDFSFNRLDVAVEGPEKKVTEILSVS